jgi:transcriptional regulator with GAF, ATPase, and Fis domain
MRSFLGVPIVLRSVAYGNLYLTEKDGGAAFTEEDEELVTLLATQAAVAIENARLYESATRWSGQLESLHEVLRSLVEEMELERLLNRVARRLSDLVGARLVLIALPSPEGDLRIEAAAGEEKAEAVLGHRLVRADSKVGRVLERKSSARVDSVLDDPEVNQDEARRLGVRTESMCRCSCAARRLASSQSTTSWAATDVSRMPTFVWPKSSLPGSPSPSIFQNVWRGRPFDASSTLRSWSAVDWRGNCTTRQGRRSPHCSWA